MKLVTVGVYPTRIEAEIAKGLLEAHKIIAYLSADDAGGMRPYPLSYTFGVELQVEEKDEEKAKELLNARVEEE